MNREELKSYAPAIFTDHRAMQRTSEQFTHVSTLNVVEMMEDKGFTVAQASQQSSRKAGDSPFAKHLLRFRHKDFANDKVGEVPEIVMINAHNGQASYKLMMGIYRFLCANGMIVGSTFEEESVIHRGDILADVSKATDKISDNVIVLSDRISKMKNRELSKTEQLSFAEQAMDLRFPNHRPFLSEELLAPRREEDRGSDVWHVFNRIQENVIKGGIGGLSPNVRWTVSRPITGIAQAVDLNRNLWDLANDRLAA